MINKKGFTILELLVAISIIGVVMGVSFFSQKSDATQSIADQDASVIKNNILKMYDNTIFGLVYKGYGHDNGFGVYFNMNTPKKYILFCDQDEDLAYDSNEKIEDSILNNGTIKSINNSTTGDMTILFKYKDGRTYLNGTLATASNIEIKTINKTKEKTIIINPLTYKIDVQ